MATRSDIRTQCRALLNEADSSNTHFTDAQINEYIDEAIMFMATMIEYPRKFDSGTQAVDGTARYSLPTDNLVIISVYFGDTNTQNDIRPLQIVTEETLKSMYPNWLDATSSSKGRPQFAVVVDRSTCLIHPRPDSSNSASGKKVLFDYVYTPATLTSDSSSPDLPTPFHNLIQLYVAYLAYLKLNQQDQAIASLKLLSEQIKVIRSTVVKETRESLGWEWAVHDGGAGELIYGGVRFT